MSNENWFKWQDGDLILKIKVQPKSSINKFFEPEEEEIKLKITAPPVDGKANEAVIKFLSKLFGVSKSSITILSGETGRHKRIKIASPQKIPETLGLIDS